MAIDAGYGREQVEICRAALGATFDAHWRAGAALTVAEAAALAGVDDGGAPR